MWAPTFVVWKDICNIPYKINKTCPKEAYTCVHTCIYMVLDPKTQLQKWLWGQFLYEHSDWCFLFDKRGQHLLPFIVFVIQGTFDVSSLVMIHTTDTWYDMWNSHLSQLLLSVLKITKSLPPHYLDIGHGGSQHLLCENCVLDCKQDIKVQRDLEQRKKPRGALV